MERHNRCRRVAALVLALLFIVTAIPRSIADVAVAAAPAGPRVVLHGHIVPALAGAIPVGAKAKAASEPMSITVVLRRSDPAAFEAYLMQVYDPSSPAYRKFLSPTQVSDKYGPSEADYAAVQAYFEQQGLSVVERSANRLTLTLRGTRSQIENALETRIAGYKAATRTFFANDRDPSLPAGIASRVQAIAGLSNLGMPAPNHKTLKNVCLQMKEESTSINFPVEAGAAVLDLLLGFAETFSLIDIALYKLAWIGALGFVCVPGMVGEYTQMMLTNGNPKSTVFYNLGNLEKVATRKAGVSSPLTQATGNGQTIGLVEFDTFNPSDVSDFIALTSPITNTPPSIANLATVHVNGGAPLGAAESEVLLDIDLAMAVAPKARVVVYDAPLATSYEQVFNAMINGGVTIISNSWASCEDQVSPATAQAIDSILATASASGISVFNGAGDSGSTCLDGTPNTVSVPADSPHAVAVGGSSRLWNPGFVHGNETWWNGSGETPPTGQGGFGISKYFARPAYQAPFTASAARSVPDVVDNADPRFGMIICQTDNGGCPSGFLIGGTSMSTPAWAGYAALLNESAGRNLGDFNAVLYPLAKTTAFNNATSLASDFAHVGLGSPNPALLKQAILNQPTGVADAQNSWAELLLPMPDLRAGQFTAPADGSSAAGVRVTLWDANGNLVPGKTISITASSGSHATVTPVNTVTSDLEGSAIFNVTDLTPETVVFTATDVTDNITLAKTVQIVFSVPAAASAGITASPSSVAANGSSTATITVTLEDALGRPTPGKAITVAQGSGHSLLMGPTPAVTDANGQIQFTATDTVAETVTYTAVDVTDDDLPVPGSASVTFTGGSVSCAGAPPVAAPGFTVTTFANGFPAQNFFYSNVSWSGCPGASNPAFDTSGNVFVSDFYTGNLSKFGLTGGAISNGNTLATIGLTLQQPAFGKDGSLYVARGATGSGFNSGTVLKVDPNTGAVLQTLVTGLTCPSPLAVDPLSGDLFFTDTCFGAGADNPSLWRIQNTASASPSLVVYATLPSTPNGPVVFAPNGTMYVVNNYNGTGSIIQVAGTNTSSPPAMTMLTGISSDFWMTMGEVLPNGAAKSLLVHNNNALKLVDVTTNPFTTTVLANGSLGTGTIGPDGCLYAEASDTIIKVAPTAGPCTFAPTNPAPALALSPATIVPGPAQGSTQSLTATLRNVAAPAGTPVFFQVTGANAAVKMARMDTNGAASVGLTGFKSGTDVVTAYATVNGSSLGSNSVRIAWSSGMHVSFVTLNNSVQSGMPGAQVTVSAALADVSVDTPSPIQGALLAFDLGGQTCSATTDGQGRASCTLTVPSADLTLSASFAGDSQYTPDSANVPFFLAAAPISGLPGAPAITSVTGGNGQISVAFTPPASNGGSAITSYTATCTPVGGAAPVSVSGPSSPIVVSGLTNGGTYTCVVSGTNSAGTGASSMPSAPLTLIGSGPSANVQPIPALDRRAELLLVALLAFAAFATLRARRG